MAYVAKNQTQKILENIERFNAIPMKGIMHFGYEVSPRKSANGKWLNKAGTFKVIKVSGLETTKYGTMRFQGVVLDSSIAYLINGKQVSREEWYTEAGIEVAPKQEVALLTFALHKASSISLVK